MDGPWADVGNLVQRRMAVLRLEPAGIPGLSDQTVYSIWRGDDGGKRHRGTWTRLCDALDWTSDSIDRILAGLPPLTIQEAERAAETPAASSEEPPIVDLTPRLDAIDRKLEDLLTQIRRVAAAGERTGAAVERLVRRERARPKAVPTPKKKAQPPTR